MNSNKYLLKNGTIFIDGILQNKDILIEDGLIIKIEDNLNYETIIDCTNKIITYGFCDMHVHLRTPGQSHKEDITTGSHAAIHGGYTSIAAIPNTNPILDTYDKLSDFIRSAKEEGYNQIIPFSAATIQEQGLELVDMKKISSLEIAGFSDDGKGIQDDAIMKQVLIESGKYNKLVSMHCEDENEFNGAIGCMNEGIYSEKFGVKGINKASEYKMIERDLKIINEIHDQYNYQYHVCHISCAKSLQVIKEAKAKQHHVTCEVTPHHLISDDSMVDINNANYKMNPPLRAKSDVAALVEGLRNGDIDVIATDHAPHSITEKQSEFAYAPFGIVGLETSFSLLNTHLIKTGQVKLETILKCLIDNPRKLFKLDYQIKTNTKANLVIIDLVADVTYNHENTYSKSKNTFYMDMPLQGKVINTIIQNKIYNW